MNEKDVKVKNEHTQSPSALMMVRPGHFGYNIETAISNAFQHTTLVDDDLVPFTARVEFDDLAEKLQAHGVNIFIFDENNPNTPDAVFPNNWISFHEDGKVVLYPMMAKNRRLERREDIIFNLGRHFEISSILDLTRYEHEEKYLEGTGSIVFDYVSKVAYACRSPRTDEQLFRQCCSSLGYTPVLFDARDSSGKEIYHTNVMMAIADNFCVVCLESIDKADRNAVREKLYSTGHEIVEISYDQMNRFAGNMIQVSSESGKKFMVMSQAAYQSLNGKQLSIISNFNEPIFSDLSTVESCGGGSARCMIAGIYLPLKKVNFP